MPHQRKRHVVNLLKKLASFWSIVGIIGPRQVGKTTILRNLLGGFKSDVTLDDEENKV